MPAVRIREVLFGNWRNKGIALFFAVTIWYVAYKAETQTETIPVRLVPTTRQDGIFIIRQECSDPLVQGRLISFDGTVRLSVTGPRRQVEKLRGDGPPREVKFPVEFAGADLPTEAQRVGLGGEKAFPFIPSGVKVDSISPESILITFDNAVEKEIRVTPDYLRIPEGMEEEAVKVEPPTVKLSGPRSLVEGMSATVEAWIGAAEYEENLPVIKKYPESVDRALVDRTVRFVGPSKVKLSVRLRYKSDTFDADNVQVRFLVPPSKIPFRIRFDDEMVKVRFLGPLAEIARLQKIVKDPEFALAVRVDPQALQFEENKEPRERTGTFTEDSLLLYRFSDRIQILQHPDRQAQGKGPWTFSIVPIPAPRPAESD